jgi:hypothetical protein
MRRCPYCARRFWFWRRHRARCAAFAEVLATIFNRTASLTARTRDVRHAIGWMIARAATEDASSARLLLAAMNEEGARVR